MIEKLITASLDQTLGKSPKPEKHPFDIGTKFQLNDQVWIVKKAWVDNGSQFRLIQSQTSGDENYLQLHTLQKDADSPDFVFLEPTPTDLAMLKAMRRD